MNKNLLKEDLRQIDPSYAIIYEKLLHAFENDEKYLIVESGKYGISICLNKKGRRRRLLRIHNTGKCAIHPYWAGGIGNSDRQPNGVTDAADEYISAINKSVFGEKKITNKTDAKNRNSLSSPDLGALSNRESKFKEIADCFADRILQLS